MLTDLDIANLPVRNKAYNVNGGAPGLRLHVTPEGKRHWFCRVQINGRRKEMACGTYPETTVAQARDICRHIRLQPHQGLDPVQVLQLTKVQLTRLTLDGIPHSQENIAEAVRISALKLREAEQPAPPPSISLEDRVSKLEQRVEELTSSILAVLALIAKR